MSKITNLLRGSGLPQLFSRRDPFRSPTSSRPLHRFTGQLLCESMGRVLDDRLNFQIVFDPRWGRQGL